MEEQNTNLAQEVNEFPVLSLGISCHTAFAQEWMSAKAEFAKRYGADFFNARTAPLHLCDQHDE